MTRFCFFLQFFRSMLRRLELAAVQAISSRTRGNRRKLRYRSSRPMDVGANKRGRSKTRRWGAMSAFRHAVHYRETLHIYSQLDAAITETPNRTAHQGRDGSEVIWDTSERKSLWESHGQCRRKVKCRVILMWFIASGCCRVVGDTAPHAESPGFRYWFEDRMLRRAFSWFSSVRLQRLRLLLEIR